MIPSQDSPAAAPGTDSLASWYTPSLVDGFGDRLLMFDNTETDSLELLRFQPSLAATAGFEDALRERVRQVGRIPDEAFPLIVAVERFEGDNALALVSTHTAGKRVSAVFDKPGPRRGLKPPLVSSIIAEVMRALTLLQAKGADIAHSAITPERVIVSLGGRICLTEHVLGAALRRLDLSAPQLWREFGLVSAPTPSGEVHLDARTDVYQVGVLALEMLLGRRLARPDHERIPQLLEQWSDAAARDGLASHRLRVWLERSLQLSDDSYGDAAEAFAGLGDMPSESAGSLFEALPAGDASAPDKPTSPPAAEAPEPALAVVGVPAADAAPVQDDLRAEPPATVEREQALVVPSFAPLPFASQTSPPAPSESAPEPSEDMVRPQRSRSTSRRLLPWIAAAMGVVAIVEGLVMARLLMRQPAAPAQSSASAPTQSPIPAAPEPPPPITPVEAAPAVALETPETRALSLIEEAASRQRSGGVRFVTPVELKVLQGERVLGSTADGPIVAPAGTHQLDLINTALGIRLRRAVSFRSGEISTLDVAIPPGRLSVNALPWAEVLIDNRPIGETPLANVPVPVGDHEVVFRHPELGERRQTVTVRADGTTRVSTSFDR